MADVDTRSLMSHDGDDPSATEADRLRLALELQSFGIEVMRENLRRRDPDVADAALEVRLRQWLCRRPFDAPGVRRRDLDW